MGSNQNRYSPEEDAVIREAYEKDLILKRQMHRLPGRSYEAAVQRALYLVLIKKTKMERVHALMADGKARTAEQIERTLGVRRKYVCELLAELSQGDAYHIVGYTGAHRQMVFKKGPGKNAVMPPPMMIPNHVYARIRAAHRRDDSKPPRTRAVKATAKPKRAVDDRVKDEKYRAPSHWWPSADPLVAGAMRAMVEAGRASA